MGIRHYFRQFKKRTVQNRLTIIISLVIFVLLVGLVNFRLSMRVMSGTRAYVGGEGLWSKAQKEAVFKLVRYTNSGDESDYQEFLKYTEVQLGDKQARLEMDKPRFDRNIVREGFIKGGNHPDDVRDLIFLYRGFRDVSYMRTAVEAWTEGDKEIENLLYVGEQIHELVSTPPMPDNPAIRQARAAELASLVEQVYEIDERLTILEDKFSATLNEGARGIAWTLLWINIGITALLGLLSLVVGVMVSRHLVRLDKLKTDFVSLASHQLRTPLTAINWSSESLLAEKSGKLTQAQKRYIEALASAGQRMANLISDLLRVSSIEMKTYELNVEEVNLRSVLDGVVKDQQKEIKQKKINLDLTVDARVPMVQTDEQILREVLENLLSNSIKYTPEDGRIDIQIQTMRTYALIRVSDTGIGIPKSQQSQIFSKLFRADNAQRHNSAGTGLGLYIAKALVKMLNGNIWFDSVEDKGTNFYVKLPLYSEHYSKRKGSKNG